MGLSPGCSPYSLSLSSPPSPWNTPPPILGSSLPDGCEDFTLGSCNTEQDELIEKYTGIPDAPGCQALCGYIERCQHFRYTKSSQECELFHFRFLTTCNIVAGPKAPLVAACSKEDAEGGSCHSFISEDCIYSGTPVMATDGLTTSSACQDILIQLVVRSMPSTSCSIRGVSPVSCMIVRTCSVSHTVGLNYPPYNHVPCSEGTPSCWIGSLCETLFSLNISFPRCKVLGL